MDKETKKSLEQIMNAGDLNPNEKKLIEYSHTAVTADMNHSKVLSEFLLTKQLKRSTEEIIKSNKILSDSQNEQSKKMQRLTWVLVAVSFLQVLVMAINLYISYKK